MSVLDRRLGVGVALMIAMTASAANAYADEGSVAEAERLFQEARVLVERGNYPEACPKLVASQKLEPALGTQFNLADCYEHVGRAASAHALFTEVASIARAAGKFERERSARARAEALLPRLARVRLQITAPAPGEEIRIDDGPPAQASAPEGLLLDPGVHHLRASAPERKPWEQTITLTEGKSIDVTVPALIDPRPVVTAPPPPPRSSTQRTVALVAGGVGLVAVGVGSIAGVMALSKRSTAERECPKDPYRFHCPTGEGTDAWNSAGTAGNVSTVAFVVGGVALAGAAVLWFTAPSKQTRVGASFSSVVVEGSF